MVSLPYKYPYLTIFIVGYYIFEHLGYYYKIRNWLGFKEVNEISYLVPFTSETYGKLSSRAPIFLHVHKTGIP